MSGHLNFRNDGDVARCRIGNDVAHLAIDGRSGVGGRPELQAHPVRGLLDRLLRRPGVLPVLIAQPLRRALSLAPAVAAVVGLVLLFFAGGRLQDVGLALVLAYAVALLLSGVHAAVRFRSLAVGALEPVAVVASQAAYLAGFARGLTD